MKTICLFITLVLVGLCMAGKTEMRRTSTTTTALTTTRPPVEVTCPVCECGSGVNKRRSGCPVCIDCTTISPTSQPPVEVCTSSKRRNCITSTESPTTLPPVQECVGSKRRNCVTNPPQCSTVTSYEANSNVLPSNADYNNPSIDQSTQYGWDGGCCTRIYLPSGADPAAACTSDTNCKGYTLNVERTWATLKSNVNFTPLSGVVTYVKKVDTVCTPSAPGADQSGDNNAKLANSGIGIAVVGSILCFFIFLTVLIN
jgi:hypothetical protein